MAEQLVIRMKGRAGAAMTSREGGWVSDAVSWREGGWQGRRGDQNNGRAWQNERQSSW